MKLFWRIFVWFVLCAVPFWVVEDGGFVALWGSDIGIIYRSDTPISALPAEEANAIRSKIPCYSAEEAARYMENFCS